MNISKSERLAQRYPEAGFIAIIAEKLKNQQKNNLLEKEKLAAQAAITGMDDPLKTPAIKQYERFYKGFGKQYPVAQHLLSIKKGRPIPASSTLKDAMFLTELKHGCLISGHDLGAIKGELLFDITDGKESYTKLNSQEQGLMEGDIVLRKDGRVIASMLYGPDCTTKLTEKTSDCIYFLWMPYRISHERMVESLCNYLNELSTGEAAQVSEVETAGGKEFLVTPWEVKGAVDYDKLIKQFGTEPLTGALTKKIEKAAGRSHHMLRRRIFFSHRELDVLLKEHAQGKRFALYTGRGPSGQTHVGHLIPWIFTKYLQDAFRVPLYFQITDDEKFLYQPKLSLEDTHRYALENSLDLIALGFDPEKTFIIIDTDNAGTLYRIALQVAKKVTASTARSVFGFSSETNIGLYFWPAMQAAPCFLPSVLEGEKIRTLIPAAIDQDPYWRIVRDVAPRLGYPKTAAMHCVFLPALTGPSGKMSTSTGQESTVFTTDDEKTVRKKIMKYAFSGGQATVAEHREKGGNPDVDVSYQWLTFFEEDDKRLARIHDDYKSGKLLSGELKQILADKLWAFLKEHQRRREQARKSIGRFLLKDRQG